VLAKGRDAVVSIILDGENAWENYPKSGREFLRRFYDGLQREAGVEAVTVSEAIARHKDFGKMTSLVPGSWINANLMCGSARRRTIAPGITFTTRANFTRRMRQVRRRRSASWRSRSY